MKIRSKIKKYWTRYNYRWSPLIPSANFKNTEERRNWILYMVRRSGRYPVSELESKIIPNVSSVTLYNDFKVLEEQKLIRREKDKTNKSFILPMFDDSGEAVLSKDQQRREFILNFGLPLTSLFLLIILIGLH